MPERAHLSIGEVLSLLREEFPDVTISKIRFLESQGLVDPERTPSGYRKFYEPDVERLRWILRQQREHFLPLKVIRGRLSEQESAGGLANGPEADEAEPAATPVAARAGAAASSPGRGGRPPGGGRSGPAVPSLFAGLHPEPGPSDAGPTEPATGEPGPTHATSAETVAIGGQPQAEPGLSGGRPAGIGPTQPETGATSAYPAAGVDPPAGRSTPAEPPAAPAEPPSARAEPPAAPAAPP